MSETRKNANRSTKPPRPTQKLLTLQQASIEYGPPYNTLRDLVLSGAIPKVVFDTDDHKGRRIWIRRLDIDRFLERSVERIGA